VKPFLLAGVFSWLLSAAVQAAPVVIDFEGLPDTPESGGAMFYGTSVVEDGFEFTTNASFGGFAVRTPTGLAYTGSKALFANTIGAFTALAQQNGNPFAIFSIDLAFTNPGQTGTADVTFTGVKSDTSIVQQIFTVGPGFVPAMQTFNFSSDFGDIVSLTWLQGSASMQFDNINADTEAVAAPAPAPLGLALFGLAGITALRRKSA
jgi:hypothetical protein